MALAVDATTDAGAKSGSSTFSHTCSSETNRILLVGLSGDNKKPTAVTYDGVAMTLASEVGPENARWAQIWYLKDPATGSNTVSVTKPDSAIWGGGAISFDDADDPIGIGAIVSELDGDASVSVTPEGDSGFIVDAWGGNDSAVTVGSGQTEYYARASVEDYSGSYESHSGSSVTMDWSGDSSTVSGHVAVEVMTEIPDVEPSINDTVTVTESITVMVSEEPNVNDEVTITEVVTMMVSEEPNVNDEITITESVTVELEGGPSAIENISVSEDVTVVIDQLVPDVNDEVTVTESITMDLDISIDVNDDISVEESIQTVAPTGASAAEDITVTESVSVMTDLNIDVNDSITVAESFTVVVAAARTDLVHMRSVEQEYPLMMDEDEIR